MELQRAKPQNSLSLKPGLIAEAPCEALLLNISAQVGLTSSHEFPHFPLIIPEPHTYNAQLALGKSAHMPSRAREEKRHGGGSVWSLLSELVLARCRKREKEAAAAHIENPKKYKQNTDTRPLANACCFTGSSASPAPAMCSQRRERQTAPGDQATPSGKTKKGKNVVVTIGKGGMSFRA